MVMNKGSSSDSIVREEIKGSVMNQMRMVCSRDCKLKGICEIEIKADEKKLGMFSI